MKIKLIASESLIQTSKSQVVARQSENSKILGLSRRQFIKLTCAGTVGLSIPVATNIFYPDEAEAQWQWVNLIPIVLAGIQITEKIIQYGQKLYTFIQAENNNPVPQTGNIGTGVVTLVRSEPIYQSSFFIDQVPAFTRNTYQIEYPSGPRGQNLALAASQINRVQSQFSVT